MKTIKLKMLAFKIEYHWWFIIRYRKRGNHLIEAGELLTSTRLIRLSRLISAHGVKAAAAKTKYECIAGLA